MRSPALIAVALLFSVAANAQSPAPDSAKLDAITKKLDELNVKVDALSQEVLKLEQHAANTRPGVIIGEPTPPPTAPPQAPASPPAAQPAGAGNTHTIAKGETLTSIAKQHRVTIDELQKANHIENDRKLQVGQTLIIPPPSASGTPAASSSPTTP